MNERKGWQDGKKRYGLAATLLVLVFVLATVPGLAQTGPDSMNFQGRLLDSGGTPLGGEQHCLRFRMCFDDTDEDSCTDTQVWPDPPGYEYHQVTTESGPYKDGLFTVALGSVTGIEPALLYEQDMLYLEVGVSDKGDSCDGIDETYEVLEPRSQLRASAYAQRSRRVHTTEADDEALITVWNSGQGEGIWARTDSAASGSAAGYFYHAGGSSVTYGLYGQSDSTSGYGVYGDGATGVYGSGATGVEGESSASGGRGVYGYASATASTTYGVAGVSDSTAGRGVFGGASAASGDAYGVYGWSGSTSGRGVYGYANATSGDTHGVHGQSDSSSGAGVYGSGATGVYGSGDTGVAGESASTSGMGVLGYASAASGTTFGVWGTSNSTSGTGVWGDAFATSGETYGVFGTSNSTSGRGVYGYALSTSGETYGVYGLSSSTEGGRGVYGYGTVGVYGESSVSWGAGVYGLSGTGSSLTAGVHGESYSTSGRGVVGEAYAASGTTYGVRGESSSSSGTGVFGRASAASGTTYGVRGESESTEGRGVYGYAAAASGPTYGVEGRSDSTSGRGVYGYAAATSGTTYGVRGRSDSPSGYGVYSIGNLHATGDITCDGTKSGVVETEDHGKRTLYAMESPENWFEDFGSAQLAEGEAVVRIEAIYAQTVNLAADYRVFLTPLGDCALYVAEKSPDSFTVRAIGGATCSIAFDYRIVAKRLGYEDLRLAPAASIEEPPGGEP